MNTDIVLIDDSDVQLQNTKMLFEKNGLSVECISDSEKALPILENIKPKLVILDIMMPGLDGFTLLKSIKEHKQLKTTPVIILSGKPFVPEQRKALSLGAEMYLTKPIRSQNLLDKIKPFIQA